MRWGVYLYSVRRCLRLLSLSLSNCFSATRFWISATASRKDCFFFPGLLLGMARPQRKYYDLLSVSQRRCHSNGLLSGQPSRTDENIQSVQSPEAQELQRTVDLAMQRPPDCHLLRRGALRSVRRCERAAAQKPRQTALRLSSEAGDSDARAYNSHT